ncbi:MAG: ABC transporter substrate-binding protein [Methylococcaceae bacterium]
MRKTSFVALLFFLIGASLGYFVCQNKILTQINEKFFQRDERIVKIGAILPLSGDVASYGNNTKEGIDLAVEQINLSGGINGKKIEIIYEDSKADAKTGASGMLKLIDIDKVQAIIDNSVSSVALAAVPIADKNKVVLLSTGSTNPKLSGISPYFFRIWNSDALEGKVSANFVVDSLNYKNISIVYVNNEYGNGLAEVFKKQLLNKRGTVAAFETFEQNNTDFKNIISKLKETSSDCIYLIAYPKEIAAFLKQRQELNLKKQIVGTVTMEDKQIIEIAGNAANGVIYPFPVNPSESDPTVSNFQNTFFKKYNKKPSITSDVGYDAVYLLSMAISNFNESGDGIRQGLKAIKGFHGASGVIEFDDFGDVSKSMKMKIIKDNDFVLFTK